MTQQEREVIMKEFRTGSSRVLITTDLLARGIDVQQVSLVINYDLPSNRENYIHRYVIHKTCIYFFCTCFFLIENPSSFFNLLVSVVVVVSVVKVLLLTLLLLMMSACSATLKHETILKSMKCLWILLTWFKIIFFFPIISFLLLSYLINLIKFYIAPLVFFWWSCSFNIKALSAYRTNCRALHLYTGGINHFEVFMLRSSFHEMI